MTVEKDLMKLHQQIDICRKHTVQNERFDEINEKMDKNYERNMIIGYLVCLVCAIIISAWWLS